MGDAILSRVSKNSNVNIVQEVGTSTTDIMSQKAVTELVNSINGIKGVKVNSEELTLDSNNKVNLVPVTSNTHTDVEIPLSNFRKRVPNYSIVKKIVFPESINITATSEVSYSFLANPHSASLLFKPSSNSISLRHPSGSVTIYDDSGFADDFSLTYGFSWVQSKRTLYIYNNPEYPWQKSYTSSGDVQVLDPDGAIIYSKVTDGNAGIITSEQYYNLLQKPVFGEEISAAGTVLTNRYFENRYPIYAFSWSGSGLKGPYTDKNSEIGNSTESYRVKALLRYSGYWDTGAGVICPVPYYGANGDYFYCDVNSTTHRIESHQKLSLTSTETSSYRISVEFILI